jgi:hypothetical protein
VEQALTLVGQRIVQGQASELQTACQDLQQAMLACGRMEPQWLQPAQSDQAMRARLQQVRSGLAQVREHMARRAAAVQRSLQTLLPSNVGSTYSRSAAAFGRGSKTAASFTSLSA